MKVSQTQQKSFSTGEKIIALLVGINLIISLVILSKASGTEEVTLPSAPQPQEAPQPEAKVEASADDDPFLGKDNAPITIIEFSDFQCPFCHRFWQQTLPQIKSDYIETGKVKFVYRDFPLPFHTEADEAALAAECADDQDKFFEYHDKVFEGQQDWAGNPDPSSVFKGYAKDLKLDSKKFDSCYDSGKYKDEVSKDLAEGNSYSVSGTPTFFINGVRLVGAQPFEAFKQIIEAELSK